MKALFGVFLLLLAFSVTGQTNLTYTIAEVDAVAELPEGSVAVAKDRPQNHSNRFLTAIYSTIRYPSDCREAGLQAVVRLEYTIGADGVVRPDTSFIVSEKQMETLPAPPEDDIIYITAYATQSTNGGPASRMAPPRTTRNAKKLARAEAALLKEAERTFTALPTYDPARLDGREVAMWTFSYLVFRLE